MYSLLDSVDSESIAEECEIGRHSSKHDFENYVKIAIHEGLDPSSSLAELAETTDTADDLKYMAASTFSRYTNDPTTARSYASCSNSSIRGGCTTSAASCANGLSG